MDEACVYAYPSSRFLEKGYVWEMVDRSQKLNADTVVSIFVQAALAYGRYVELQNDARSRKASSASVQTALQQLREALPRHISVQSLQDGILKLQTYLLLVWYHQTLTSCC